jgi:hypothetical protein
LKLNKVLSVALDDPDTQAALNALAEMYAPENSLEARRNLRGDVEKRELAVNRRFLDALDAVDQVRQGSHLRPQELRIQLGPMALTRLFPDCSR